MGPLSLQESPLGRQIVGGSLRSGAFGETAGKAGGVEGFRGIEVAVRVCVCVCSRAGTAFRNCEQTRRRARFSRNSHNLNNWMFECTEVRVV